VRVLIASKDSGDINSLYDWLRADRDLVRSAEITSEGTYDQTSMGALEVVSIILTEMTGLGSLAVSFATWWQSRSKAGAITLNRPDGQQLTIAGSPEVTSDLIIDFLSGNGQTGKAPRPTT
jgi:hypothetical protein